MASGQVPVDVAASAGRATDGRVAPSALGVVPPHTETFGIGAALPTETFRDSLVRHLGAAERAGVEAFLIYNFPRALDAWALAGEVLATGRRAVPVVTVQAHQEHPFTTARRVASLGYLYGRSVSLNIVAGASAAEQHMLGQRDRAAAKRRLAEFMHVLSALFAGPVSFDGEFFVLRDAVIDAVALEPRPTLFSPGSIGSDGVSRVPPGTDCALVMAKPLAALAGELGELRGMHDMRVAMIVGMLARPATEDARSDACDGPRSSRREQLSAQLQMRDNISTQHASNHALRDGDQIKDGLLWYGAARHGIDCPKLVGSYEEVCSALLRYCAVGVTDFVVDLPADPAEYEHVRAVVERLSAACPDSRRSQR